jgi:hypothetical protein
LLALQQKNKKLEDGVRDLEARIAKVTGASAAPVSAVTVATSKDSDSCSIPDVLRGSATASLGSQHTLSDLQHMAQAARAELEIEETAVSQLRGRHGRSHAQLRASIADVQKLREAAQRLEQRQAYLQEQQLVLAAAQANPAHREALTRQQEYHVLLKQQQTQEEQIRTARLEQQALVLHLLDGFSERSEKLSELRRRMLRASMTQDSKSSPEIAAAASPSRTPEFASDLLRENEQRRADAMSTVANVAKERDALHQYISVLSQRLEVALTKCSQLDS